jgi:serine protease Do
MKKQIILALALTILLLPSLVITGCAPGAASDTLPTAPPGAATAVPSTESPTANVETPAVSSSEQPLLPSIADVVAAVKPSVVAINVEVVTTDAFGQPTTQRGAGSGWILSEDGYIVTNNHVVQDAETVMVTLDDGRVFPGEAVHTDPLTDLAVVKIDAGNLPALAVGSSSALRIGDWVVAIGNSLGMGISATQGIVSALDVSLSSSSGQTLLGLIQTDAAINPGNSGGPLVNMAGEVVGINSIKISQVGIEGMGYSISIDEAGPLIEQLIETGYVDRPWLGISIYPVDAQVAQSYDLGVDHGILITEVVAGSPAEAAGLEVGDVITAIGGQEVSDARNLLAAITSQGIGQPVEITYFRGKTEETTTATLAESPPPEFQ